MGQEIKFFMQLYQIYVRNQLAGLLNKVLKSLLLFIPRRHSLQFIDPKTPLVESS